MGEEEEEVSDLEDGDRDEVGAGAFVSPPAAGVADADRGAIEVDNGADRCRVSQRAVAQAAVVAWPGNVAIGSAAVVLRARLCCASEGRWRDDELLPGEADSRSSACRIQPGSTLVSIGDCC